MTQNLNPIQIESVLEIGNIFKSRSFAMLEYDILLCRNSFATEELAHQRRVVFRD